MDKRILIKILNAFFCDINKSGKDYTEVWLSEVDFGGMYQSDKFILNVRTRHKIDGYSDEIYSIIHLLDEKAHDELQFVWRVNIYDIDDNIHCEGYETLVFFDQEEACK